MPAPRALVVGVDACSAGWVAATWDGRVLELAVHATFAAVIAAAPRAAVLGVDMPVGLVARGPRAADHAVRAFLGRRAASLFVIPPRDVLAAVDHPDACVRAQRLMGAKISRQAFNLFPKVREVDAHVGDARIVEVHPETSFQVLAGAPLPFGKKTWAGVLQRRHLLAGAGLTLPDRFDGPADHVAPDDLLDATVAAWSAARVARGTARAFPEVSDDRDACGRTIQIRA